MSKILVNDIFSYRLDKRETFMRGGVIISKDIHQNDVTYTCHIGHHWKGSYQVRDGYWCYICSYKADVLIRLVEDFLTDSNIGYENDYCCHGSEFDFFLPGYNALVVCNPETLFHHIPDIQSKMDHDREVEIYQERSRAAMRGGHSLIRLAAGDEDYIRGYLVHYLNLITSMERPVYVFYNASFEDLPV